MIRVLLTILLLATQPVLAQQIPPNPGGDKIDRYDIKIGKYTSLNYMICSAYYSGIAEMTDKEKDKQKHIEALAISNGFKQFISFVYIAEKDNKQAEAIKTQIDDLSRRMLDVMRVPKQKPFYDASFGDLCPGMFDTVGRFMRHVGAWWPD